MRVQTMLPAFMLALFTSTASAALTVTIESSPGYLPGTNMAAVGVFVSSPGGDNFFEFEISIDVLPLGTGLPAGISLWSPGGELGLSNGNAAFLAPAGAGMSNTGGFSQGQNLTVAGQRGDGGNFVTPGVPTRLFDLTFNIAPGTTLDSYEIRFGGTGGVGSDSLIRTVGGVALTGITYNSGALNVVPEPSALSLAGIIGLYCFRRRRVG